MTKPKGEEIKVRVTKETKIRVLALAEERGESESVIVREALNQYLRSTPQRVGSGPRHREKPDTPH